MDTIQKLKERIVELELENKDLFMRLSAIKVITQKVNPVCSKKLEELLVECETCKGDLSA